MDKFLNQLPNNFRYAFEFREQSWWNDETYDLLNKHNAEFCIYHLPGKESARVVTSDTIYIRLHGTKNNHSGSYSSQQLSRWKRCIENRNDKVNSAYVFFNNDEKKLPPPMH